MKKFFFFAAIACATLASCVKNEPVKIDNQAEITFAEPVVGLNTKAPQEVWNNFPTDMSFKVWAKLYNESGYTTWDAGTTYMDAVTVSKSGSTWAPATTYYWPEGKLTFIAYAPASVNGTVDATGVKFTDYTVTTTAADQKDLLFSERAYDKTAIDDNVAAGSGTTGNTPGFTEDPYTGVHLAFKHALSSIVFSVKTAQDYTANNATITLTGLSISNIGSKATFTQGLADTNNAQTTAASWTDPTEPEEYTAFNGSQVLSNTEFWTATNSNTKPTTPENGYRPTDFILLPQTLADQNAQLNISYTIKYEGVGESITMNKSVDLSHANALKWEMGKRYLYHIIINLGTNTISFEPYVTDWVDVTPETDITIS